MNNRGRGKGLAVFHKKDFQHARDINEENISITKMESRDIDIIAIYRSQDGDIKTLKTKLEDTINLSKTTLVIGDLNICNMEKPKNQIRMFLESKRFKLIVNKATHIDGRHIDHAYILNNGNYAEMADVELVPKYYSDHDGICISWKKITNIATTEA